MAWYRQEGLQGHRTGTPRGRAASLMPAQESALVAEAAAGRISLVAAGVAWVAGHDEVRDTSWGMRGVFRRRKLKKNVPCSLAKEAAQEVQEAWKKGALQAS